MDLPPLVKTALARCWLSAVALELGMSAQPRDSVPEALWDSPLATPGLATAGQQALASCPLELQIVLVHEVAVLCGLEPGVFTAALNNQSPSDHGSFAPEPMPVVLPDFSADVITLLREEGPEAVLRQFPAMRGRGSLLQEILDTEAGIADLEGRAADLKDKADELGAKVKEILEAAP